MTIIYFLDLLGTFVFAISGMLAAANKQFDIFGAAVIAFVTAMGGGTLRDLLIGAQPVAWMQDLNYLSVIGLAVPLSYFFRSFILRLRRTMFLFDSIGIGLFTILGLQKTLDMGLHPVVALMMGVVSAVFGGVIRDLLSNQAPLIFRKEIYATACMMGGILYLILSSFSLDYNIKVIGTVLFIIAIRIAAVRRHWSLPVIR